MEISPIKVTIVDHMGSDLSVVNAARVSMSKESEWEYVRATSDEWPYACEMTRQGLSVRDAKLIGYLAENNHWTPFSHPQVTFRIQAPIIVARQWFKHMIGITRNETSRRYVQESPTFFIPDVIRSRPEGSIKQGSGGAHPESETWREAMISHCKIAAEFYDLMIDDGVAPEQARGVLPQWMMTEWIETSSLAAICRACALRLDEHAQLETREVAEQMAEVVAPLFPVSWSALMGVENG